MTKNEQSEEVLTRREAVRRISAIFGGMTLVGQAAMLSACSKTEQAQAATSDALFTDSDIALLDEIAETILPETDTPGAKAAGAGAFMAMMVTDTYFDTDQEIFRKGMTTIEARSADSFDGNFVSATADQRLGLLQTFDTEQFDYMQDKTDDAPAHFFRMMKELALLGYFTSKIGYTQAMRYVETPGRYDPCARHEPGAKAWAQHA